MSYTCGEVIQHIEDFAPLALALEGDAIGLQLGSTAQQVSRLFLALELTEAVVEEILACQAELVIVHHSPFFKPQKQLRDDWGHDRLILALVRHHVALYTAHTNLDCAQGGVNDVLAELLDIQETAVLEPTNQNIRQAGLGRIGRLPQPMTLAAFAQRIGERLGHNGVRFCGPLDKMVYTVACCGGAGAFLLAAAKGKGADVFVTADVRHHEAMQARELDLGLIDAGHFAIENPVIAVLAAYLQKCLPALEIEVSRVCADPFAGQETKG